jgi:cytochrome c oxidase subunit II
MMRRTVSAPACAAIAALMLGACNTTRSSLTPDGDGAKRVADLFWLFTAISGFVWILVIAALGLAVFRPRQLGDDDRPLDLYSSSERSAGFIVATATGLTILTVITLTAVSFFAGRGIAGIQGEESVRISVVGRQWWWEVRYQDPSPARALTTANEIHVPVGVPVLLELEAIDVIHSFWVPRIAGKQDLIPGRRNSLSIRVDRPGVYFGQCAEFCGLQHSHMGIVVVAHPPREYEAWLAAQLEPGKEPATEAGKGGRDIFLGSACVLCHSIRGTPAAARTGPDLTHLASRRTIAAGTLPMTQQDLATWIADPQAIKPGTNMPRVNLNPEQVRAIAAYLAELQ